jgi:hypothetical protein
MSKKIGKIFFLNNFTGSKFHLFKKIKNTALFGLTLGAGPYKAYLISLYKDIFI